MAEVQRRLLRLPEVTAIVGRAGSTIRKDVAKGLFPKPVHVGRSIAWPSELVQSWIDERIAASRNGRPCE
ncbi:Prophage CP4-57 regulatory protein (AlpA) [Caballeronia udeis]|uniref:Prophage CP4-57 regulatory protein (AlpA) n=1 Tax=Caballeronia udeis TaxID=1232866 RepID=A0A158EP49_9BURK|nr:AlpA family phage regulatory protein [Caballeronia udeis]SAL09352.1 Prophage CP4-57 regulatory protein (AlpA) [Caballeronia udeis]